MANEFWQYRERSEFRWFDRIARVCFIAMLALLLASLVGCGAASTLPSSSQISLNIPSNVRKCAALPKSPGAGASNRQTARYIVSLYSVAKRCGANMKVVDRLYVPYRAKVEKIAKGG